MKRYSIIFVMLLFGFGLRAGADDATNPCGLLSVHAEQGRVYMLAGEQAKLTALISKGLQSDEGVVHHGPVPGLTNQGYRGTPYAWRMYGSRIRYLSVVDQQPFIGATVVDHPVHGLSKYRDIEEHQPGLLALVQPTGYVVARRIRPFVLVPATPERVRTSFLFGATLRPTDTARLYVVERDSPTVGERDALTAYAATVGVEADKGSLGPVVEWREVFSVPSPVEKPFMAIPVDGVDVLLTVEGYAFRVLEEDVQNIGHFEQWPTDMQSGDTRVVVLQREDGQPTVLDVAGDRPRPLTFRPEDPDAEPMFDQTALDAETQGAVMSLVRTARVGRPSGVQNNDPANQRLHDIRVLTIRIHVFDLPNGNPSIIQQDVEEDVKVLRERMAQATIAVQWDGAIHNLPLPGDGSLDNGLTVSPFPFQSFNQDELHIVGENAADSVLDVFYLAGVEHQGAPKYAVAYIKSMNQTGNPAGHNFIVMNTEAIGSPLPDPSGPFTLGHEVMHILLDSVHRAAPLPPPWDPDTALFHEDGADEQTNQVGGPKRIGPNWEITIDDPTNTVAGDDDTFIIRGNAETLP